MDRSLRLWGAEAQQLLRDGHVCLLGATSTGCEILKNLVLPGLGHFTIVDPKPVTKRDLGNNFFLEQSDLGANRAVVNARVLAELNPASKGYGVAESFGPLLTNSSWFEERKVRLVIASGELNTNDLVQLGKTLQGKDISIVHAKVTGQIGIIRVQADDQYIVHAVPSKDLVVEDFRALTPFPALKAFIERYNPQDPTLTVKEYAHLPWFVVINWAARAWRAEKGYAADRMPQKYERVEGAPAVHSFVGAHLLQVRRGRGRR